MSIAREAWVFVLPPTLLGVAGLALGHPAWGAAGLLLGLGILLFFRVPRREFGGADSVVLAAGDGLITGVETVEDAAVGPGEWQRIVTFLSVFDVHVQNSPVSGEVIVSRHTRGRKVAAFREDAGDVNENHLVVIRRDDGERVGVRQIAGLIARRVVSDCTVGDRVVRGQRIGLIKFGSRVDLLLPLQDEVQVRKGDRVQTGSSPVAIQGARQ